jgi:outer membrane protein TolC
VSEHFRQWIEFWRKTAEQAYQQALINLVQAKTNRYADTAALFQALGGGWWNRPDIPKN